MSGRGRSRSSVAVRSRAPASRGGTATDERDRPLPLIRLQRCRWDALRPLRPPRQLDPSRQIARIAIRPLIATTARPTPEQADGLDAGAVTRLSEAVTPPVTWRML